MAGLLQKAGIVAIDVPFPVNGIDQSKPRHAQNDRTATETLNVCSFPPYSDREGGGKTEGTRRAWNQRFTAATGNNRILGFSSLLVATGAVPPPVAPEAIERLYPDGTVDISPTAAWLPTGSSTLHEAIDEEPPDYDTSYITGYPSQNPSVPNNIAYTFSYTTPSVVPPNTAAVVASITYQALVFNPDTVEGPPIDESDTNDGAFIILELVVGTTAVVTFTTLPLGTHDPTPWITVFFTLTSAEIDAITAADPTWANLRGRITCGTYGSWQDVYFNITHTDIKIGDQGGGPPPGPTPTGFQGKILVLNSGRCRVGILPADMSSGTLPTEQVSDPADTSLTQEMPSPVPFLGKWYVVDGVGNKVITPSTINSGFGSAPTVTDWAATQGTLPPNCRLSCVYSGRIVLARQEGSSPNASMWYMSRVLEPLDWAYASDDAERPGETSAVAGTNQYLGQPADAITALIPSGDDYLIFGGSKTMWIMEGDPGSGGRIVNLSRQTGVLGPRAWCFDETGALWFMGSGGLYKYTPGAGIVPVSGRRLFRALDRINAANIRIHLAYNAFRKEVMIFLTPIFPPSLRTRQKYSYTVFSEGMGTHIRYDIVRDAFHFRTFPWDSMGPWATLEIQGSTDDDRTYLIGGRDGYVRRPFEGGHIAGTQRYGTADDMPRTGSSTPSSDGACFPITSSFRSAPIEWENGEYEIHATEIHATGTDNNLPLALPNGQVKWSIVAGNSPASVAESGTTEATGYWFGSAGYDFQDPVGVSVSAGALQVVVQQQANSTKSWALDRITLFAKRGGRRR